MIKITEIRNAKSKSPDNSSIDVEINHPEYGWIPFLWVSDDTEALIDVEALRNLIGDNFEPYSPPTFTEQELATGARTRRNFLLAEEVDPIVTNPLRWAALTEEKRAAFSEYRQQLLDITEQAGFPHNIDWPIKPE